MGPAPAGRVRSGACPLCTATVPAGKGGHIAIAVLAHHFGTACDATRLGRSARPLEPLAP